MSDAERETLYRLVRAAGGHQALGPLGLRFRLPTQDDDRFYAFQRTDASGSLAAIVVLNFQSTAQDVTVDLEGTGITIPQTPIDLVDGGAAPAITSNAHTVTLPPFGFTVLGLDVLPAP